MRKLMIVMIISGILGVASVSGYADTATQACSTAINQLSSLIQKGPANGQSVFQDVFEEATDSWTALASCPAANIKEFASENCTNLKALATDIKQYGDSAEVEFVLGKEVISEMNSGCAGLSSALGE